MNIIGKLLVILGAAIVPSLMAQPSQDPVLGTPDELGPNYKLWNRTEPGPHRQCRFSDPCMAA